jgi:general secretion pathway protein F
MEAASEEAVIRHLKETGQLPVSVKLATGEGRLTGQGRLFRVRGISRTELNVFTRELARLIGAGVSLDRSLSILASVAEDAASRRLMTRLLEGIRGGATFADALEAQGSSFTRLYVSMVRAGEAGGALGTVLERLADYLERANQLRSSVTAALIYPAILLVVSLLSLILLLTFVVPQFQRMFSEAGAALPLPTQIVIAVANWLQDYWWSLLLILMVVLLAIPKVMAQPRIRESWDRFLLSISGVGSLVGKVEIARFCRTLSTLLKNGVVLLTALSIVKETMGNRVLANSVQSIAESLKSGETLSQPMLEAGLFPKLACHMVRVGEETGRLDEMLMDVADIYDNEVEQSLKKLLSFLEPALILTLGVLIAGIIFSILIALLSINELAF